MADGDPQPNASTPLRPANFLGYLAAAGRVYRPVLARVAVPFFVVTAILATATAFGAAGVDDAGSRGGVLGMYAVQLLGLPFLTSLLTARAESVMVGSLTGSDITLREAGRRTRTVRSHLVAAAAVAAFMTLILLLAMGLLGALVAAHVFLGPTILVSVILFEEGSFQEGWIRTRELLRGHGMRLFLYLLCIALALVLVEVLLSQVTIRLAVAAAGDGALANLALPFTGWISGTGAWTGLGLSFMSAVGLVAYFDLRTNADDDFEVADLAEGPEEQPEPEA